MNINELRNKGHVKNSPIIKGLKRQQRLVQANLNRHAQQHSLTDMFSALKPGAREDDRQLHSLVKTAVSETNDLLNQFYFPVAPQLAFTKVKNVKYAKHDDSEVVSGCIMLNCKIASLSGVDVDADIPVHVERGELVLPSVLYQDGREHVIAQSTIDMITQRHTSYALPELRQQGEPPYDLEEAKMATESRNAIGYQPRKPIYLDEVTQNNDFRDKRPRIAAKGAPLGFKIVKEEMDKAEADGLDTFPRPIDYILATYVRPIMGEVYMSAWAPALTNGGYAINPYGENRGRPKTGSRRKVAGLGDKFIDNFGDVNWLEHGGKLLFEGESGPYVVVVDTWRLDDGQAEGESDPDMIWDVYRVDIEDGFKEDENGDVIGSNGYTEWWSKRDEMEGIASTVGQDVEEFIDDITSEDLKDRFFAYDTIAATWGWENLEGGPADQYDIDDLVRLFEGTELEETVKDVAEFRDLGLAQRDEEAEDEFSDYADEDDPDEGYDFKEARRRRAGEPFGTDVDFFEQWFHGAGFYSFGDMIEGYFDLNDDDLVTVAAATDGGSMSPPYALLIEQGGNPDVMMDAVVEMLEENLRHFRSDDIDKAYQEELKERGIRDFDDYADDDDMDEERWDIQSEIDQQYAGAEGLELFKIPPQDLLRIIKGHRNSEELLERIGVEGLDYESAEEDFSEREARRYEAGYGSETGDWGEPHKLHGVTYLELPDGRWEVPGNQGMPAEFFDSESDARDYIASYKDNGREARRRAQVEVDAEEAEMIIMNDEGMYNEAMFIVRQWNGTNIKDITADFMEYFGDLSETMDVGDWEDVAREIIEGMEDDEEHPPGMEPDSTWESKWELMLKEGVSGSVDIEVEYDYMVFEDGITQYYPDADLVESGDNYDNQMLKAIEAKYPDAYVSVQPGARDDITVTVNVDEQGDESDQLEDKRLTWMLAKEKEIQSDVRDMMEEGVESWDWLVEAGEDDNGREARRRKAQQVRLDAGQFGWDYLLVNEETGEDILIQTDWDYPGVASYLGWQHICPDGEAHGETDGTVDCPVCGESSSDMIGEAGEFLDDHIGDTFEDPGYFSESRGAKRRWFRQGQSMELEDLPAWQTTLPDEIKQLWFDGNREEALDQLFQTDGGYAIYQQIQEDWGDAEFAAAVSDRHSKNMEDLKRSRSSARRRRLRQGSRRANATSSIISKIDNDPRSYIGAKKLIDQTDDKLKLAEKLEAYFTKRDGISTDGVNWGKVVDAVHAKFGEEAVKDNDGKEARRRRAFHIPIEEVEFDLEIMEDDVPVRGNAIVSGDDDLDKEVEDEILERLETGDLWAWCTVKVTAEWEAEDGRIFSGEDYLGGCSYRDEEDFTEPGGYYDDMKEQAYAELLAEASGADPQPMDPRQQKLPGVDARRQAKSIKEKLEEFQGVEIIFEDTGDEDTEYIVKALQDAGVDASLGDYTEVDGDSLANSVYAENIIKDIEAIVFGDDDEEEEPERGERWEDLSDDEKRWYHEEQRIIDRNRGLESRRHAQDDMIPQVWEGSFYALDFPSGTEFIDASWVDESLSELKNANFAKGGVPEDVREVQGWGAQLVSPDGVEYTDLEVFDTEDEARASLKRGRGARRQAQTYEWTNDITRQAYEVLNRDKATVAAVEELMAAHAEDADNTILVGNLAPLLGSEMDFTEGSSHEIVWEEVIENFQGGTPETMYDESYQMAASRQAMPMEEDLEMDGPPMELEEFIDEEPAPKEPRKWPGTKAPMENGDKAKFNGHDGPIRGKIVEIDEAGDTLILESKGMQYRVVVDDVEALPSTMNKMWKE